MNSQICSAKQRPKFLFSIVLKISRSILKKVSNQQLVPSTACFLPNRRLLRNSSMRTSIQNLSGLLSLSMEHPYFLSKRKMNYSISILTSIVLTALQKRINTHFHYFLTFQNSFVKFTFIPRQIFITLTTQFVLLKVTNVKPCSISITDHSNSLSLLQSQL